MIIEIAGSGADRGPLPFDGCPRPSNAWRKPVSVRDLLRFDAATKIEAHPGGENPMILSEEVGLDIGNFEVAAPAVDKALSQSAGGVENIHRVVLDVTVFIAAGDIRADFPVMRSPTSERRETEGR